MAKFFLFLFLVFVFYYADKKLLRERAARKRKKQINVFATFQKNAKAIQERYGREQAIVFIRTHSEKVMTFPSEAFNQFKEIIIFLDNLGDDYNEKETQEFLDGTYKKKDIEKFSQLLINAILNPA